jgi:uncharacterized protein YerC
MKHYKQLDQEQRYHISGLLKAGQSINHRRSHAGLVQQTVQIVARCAITI